MVLLFSEENVLSDESKICHIFEYKSNKNRGFLEDTGMLKIENRDILITTSKINLYVQYNELGNIRIAFSIIRL